MEITKENLENFKDAKTILVSHSGKNSREDGTPSGTIQFCFVDSVRGNMVESKSQIFEIGSFVRTSDLPGPGSRYTWECFESLSAYDETVKAVFQEFLRVGDNLRLSWEGGRHYNEESQIVVDTLSLRVNRGKKNYTFLLDSRMTNKGKYPSSRMVQGQEVEKPVSV